MPQVLTTLQYVKDWIGVNTNDDNSLLTRMIDQQSRFILSYIQRPVLALTTFTDSYDGKGTVTQMLRNWPVISVNSVQIGYQSIYPFTVPPTQSPSAPYGSGYVVDPWDGTPPGKPQAVSLRGYQFYRGLANIQIVYKAGFVVQNEAQTVPAGSLQVFPNNTYGNFSSDIGVTYASTGVALTPVASSPSTGQYVPPSSPNLFYQFASGDAAANVLINYNFIPSDLEEACVEMIAERYSYKSRIGLVSKSLGGQETMAYSQKNMPDYIKSALQPYKRVILV